MASLSDQLEEMRVNAEGSLSTPGSDQEIRAAVAAMADIPLPPSSKYRYIVAESMLTENSTGNNRNEVINIPQQSSECMILQQKANVLLFNDLTICT